MQQMKTWKTSSGTQALSAPAETEALYKLAADHGHTVNRFPIHRCGLSIEDDGKCYIALRPDLFGQKEKEVLAHELGHCEAGGFYTDSSRKDVISRSEYRANKWAFLRLLPVSWVRECIKHGICTAYMIAEEAGVSCEFAHKALSYYSSLGLI